MANETGSVFQISEELVKKIEAADKAFEKLVQNSQRRVTEMNKVFDDIANGSGLRAFKEALKMEMPNLGDLTTTSGKIATNFANTSNSVLDISTRIEHMSGSLAQMVQILNGIQHIDTGKLFGAGTLERAVDNWIQGGANIKNAIAARILGKQGDAQNIAEYEAMLKRLSEATQKAEERLRAASQQATQTARTTKQAAADLRSAKDATTNEKEILEAKKQARIRKEQEIEDQRLAKAEERLAAAILSVAAARERALLTEERLQKKAVVRENSKDFNSAMTYASTPGNVDTYNKRALAIKVLQEAIKNLTDDERKNTDHLERMKRELDGLTKKQKETLGTFKQQTEETKKSLSKVFDLSSQLGRSIALAFSVSSIKGYVEKLAEVRGEFELQQRSLEAILQDKPKADQIFEKTVQLAVRSPFRIKDLVTYTKQLAAYRIESGKLYDTTKRLADVSAGLGVDMQRLILAYGQIKAASFLKGTEVRQLSEAGINVYGELQRYYEEVQGKSYTIAQIVDMISKRKVAFEDVEQIFKRLTDQGGLFFNMQEVQAETLQGKISNLKDSYDILLNEIGKSTEPVLKGMVDATSWLLKHWQMVATVCSGVAGIWSFMLVRQIAISQAVKGMIANLVAYKALVQEGNGIFKSMLGSWKAGIAGLATGLAIAGIVKLVSMYREHTRRIEELDKANAERISTLHRTKREFDVATQNAIDAKAKGSKIDEKTAFVQQKAMLAKLQEQMKKANITIPVEMEYVTRENITKVFNEAQARLKEHNLIVDYIVRQNESDGLKGVIKDFVEAGDSFYAVQSKVKDTIDNLYATFKDKLTLPEIDALDKLAKGAEKGETQIDYLRRAIKELQLIDLFGASGNRLEVANTYQKLWIDPLTDALNGYEKASKKMESKWRKSIKRIMDMKPSLVGNMNSISQEVAAQARTDFADLIKDIAVQEKWTGVAEDAWYSFASKWAEEMGVKGLVISFSEESVKKEASWINLWLEDFFSKKQYKINIGVDESGLSLAGQVADDIINANKTAKTEAEKLKQAYDLLVNGFKSSNKMKVSGVLKQFLIANDVIKAQAGSGTFSSLTPWNKDVEQEIQYQEVNLEKLKDLLKKYETIAGDAFKETGGDPKKDANAAAKREKDIWEARIDVIKKMQARYDSIRKYLDEKSASDKTKEYFKDAALATGLSEDFIKNMRLDNGGIVESIQKLIDNPPSKASAKDIAKLKAWQAEVEIKINEEELRSELDRVKREVDKAFDGLTLHTKLSDLGMYHFEIEKLFPGLTQSVEQLRNKIYEAYEITPEMANANEEKIKEMLGTDKYKQYISEIDRLNKQEIDHQRSTVEQLLKDYKNKLSDQLQIDLWYFKEREKIQKNVTDEALAKELEANLKRQYDKKTSEQTWKDFQRNDYYLMVFESMEFASKRLLKDMRERLSDLREQLKDLDPAQLKAITSQIEKMDEQISNKGIINLVANLKEAVRFTKERKDIEDKLIESQNRQKALTSQKSKAGIELEVAKKQYDLALKLYGQEAMRNPLAQEQINKARELVSQKQEELDITLEKLVAEGKISEEMAKQIQAGEQSQKAIVKSIGQFNQIFSALHSSYVSFTSHWNGIFGTASDSLRDDFESTQKIGEGLMQMGQGLQTALEGYYNNDTVKTIQGVSQALNGTAEVTENVLEIKHDTKYVNLIRNLAGDADYLSKAYKELKEKMDQAWDVTSLEKYSQLANENLEKQAQAFDAMSKAEDDKKDTDNQKVKEYRTQAEELRKAIKKNNEELLQELGGFGDSGYKSAAQSFADAWVDAYGECSDTLEALNDEFDNVMKNIVKKQAMQRFAKVYLGPLFDKIDNALVDSNGKARGVDEMATILGEAVDEAGPAMEGLNEAFKRFMELLKQKGIDISDVSGLSALQQGIQGVTEKTAEALESLLNSMRFFLSAQQADVALIRSYLAEHFGKGVAVSDESPMLSELRAQTALQRSMNNILSDVAIYSNRKGGRGIKVYME